MSVITDDVAYELRYKTVYAHIDTTDKNDKGDHVEEIAHCYREFEGIIYYAKFDKDHNKAIFQALKECGYNAAVHVMEEKKK